MSVNKSEKQLEENGKLLETIKMKHYYVWLILAIVITILAIIGIIDEMSDSSMMYRINYSYRRSIGSVILIIVLIFKLMKDAKKKVYIYEKCIMIGNSIINYNDIESVQFDVSNALERRYLQIKVQNRSLYTFNIAHYNMEQMKLILEYIERYSDCNTLNSIEIIENAQTNEKKEIRMALIAVAIFIVIAILAVKYYFPTFY